MRKIRITIAVLGCIISLQSCKQPAPKPEAACTKSTSNNFDVSSKVYDCVDGYNPTGSIGTIKFDTTNKLEGTYTSTIPRLGASGTYTKDCRLSDLRLTPSGTSELIVCKTDVVSLTPGSYSNIVTRLNLKFDKEFYGFESIYYLTLN